MKFSRLFVAALIFAVGPSTFAAEGSAYSRAITGGVFRYDTQPGDTLKRIGARFGISSAVLAKGNDLASNTALEAGDSLWVYNRHIVPEWREDGIVINIPQRMLFLFHRGTLVASFPVGLGKPDWPTPTGNFTISNIQFNKDWVVPPSIQEEMRLEGKTVVSRIPPGPQNPLGRHWIGLSAAGYGIHGTSVPTSIYSFPSHGCIRAHPDDIAALSEMTQVGINVESVYITSLLAEMPDGRIFLEVHRDAYNKGIDPLSEVRKLARNYRLENRINWQRAIEVVQRQEGLAIDVTALP